MDQAPPKGPLHATASGLYPALDASLAQTAAPLGRAALTRRLSYIMLVRVVLFTLLLGGTVAVNIAWGTPEELAGPYVMVLFVLITTVYLINILYAMLLRSTTRLQRMARLQIGIDLLLSAVLVHFTGSAESGFVLFFFLTPITAAVTLGRRAAVATAAVASVVLGATVLLGFVGVLPVLSGQRALPWEVPPSVLGRSLLINTGAMFALAALSDYLADQVRHATTHVEAQQEQIDNLAALHADVIRCLTSGLITIDARGRVLTVNEAAAEMLRVDAQQAQWRPLAQLVPELAEAALSPEPIRRGEILLQQGGRSRTLGISVSHLTSKDGHSIGRILNFQDLTPLREMEQTIKRSEHLAALGRVAAGVAHEIRNPMASISGSLQLLRRDSCIEGDNSRLMDIALREIERLDGLIGDLLDYARPKAPTRLKPLDLGLEIAHFVANISALLSSQDAPRVVVTETRRGLRILADPDQLTGVLWNLVRNSWQADEHERVEVKVTGTTDEVHLAVSDRGKGIAPDDLEHILEPFYTTRDKGSGLGLAIVHRAVQDHGAKIAIDSTVGRGTTVTINFPRLSA